MEQRYIRNLPALTEEECSCLKGKRILIVGCGGLGGYLLEMMLRIGIGTIRVCDGDVFEPSNLNRQLLSEVSLLGSSKVQAAVLRGRQVNPETVIEAYSTPMTQANVFELLHSCDAVLDALDSIESRKILAHACGQADIPYIFGAIGGWVAQAAVSMPGDGLVDVLYPDGTSITDKSVLSFTPALCASLQAALCIKLLVGRPVETGRLYYFDLLHQEYETIALQ